MNIIDAYNELQAEHKQLQESFAEEVRLNGELFDALGLLSAEDFKECERTNDALLRKVKELVAIKRAAKEWAEAQQRCNAIPPDKVKERGTAALAYLDACDALEDAVRTVTL